MNKAKNQLFSPESLQNNSEQGYAHHRDIGIKMKIIIQAKCQYWRDQ